eukprot:173254_1
MNFYRNQEVQITAKFMGIADNGNVQIKIKGIDKVQFEVDPKYVNAAGGGGGSATTTMTSSSSSSSSPPKEKKKKKEKKTAMDEAADAAWGSDGDDDEEKEEAPKKETTSTIVDTSDCSVGDEKFHPKHKYKSLVIEENTILKTTESKSVMCAFGAVECKEDGKIYHWKIKIVEGNDVNLGVIFSDQCKKNKKQMWWLDTVGWSYWGDDGQIYHSDKYKKYGATYGAGDIIDVWLNLKKYNISFAKNDEKYGKAFKVKKESSYRFAVGLAGHPHTIQMLHFEIN